MTQCQTIHLQCPACHRDIAVTAWSTLNSDVTPEGKELLLADKLNQPQCDACGAGFKIDIPFLYHDMTRAFVVQYLPPAEAKDGALLRRFTPNGRFLFKSREVHPTRVNYLKDIHVVFSMNELVRYVIFRDRLYDYYNREGQHRMEPPNG